MLKIAAVVLVLGSSECFGLFLSTPKLDPRIVGGEEADIESHPYQLSLQLWDSHTCGASVISRKWAVTAGHCAGYSAPMYKIVAGHQNYSKGKVYNVSRVITHPQYDFISIDYDVALLQIETEFTYGPNVRPINLPERELDQGERVNVTGWGAITQGGSVSRLLMRVGVPIVGREACGAAYKYVKDVTERMICAGELESGGKDSCQGDSGGPLSANGTLYGIVSWGYGCAVPNYPGVYSNVAVLRPWITEITGI